LVSVVLSRAGHSLPPPHHLARHASITYSHSFEWLLLHGRFARSTGKYIALRRRKGFSAPADQRSLSTAISARIGGVGLMMMVLMPAKISFLVLTP